MKDFIYILLLLLAASMALGAVSWLGGGSFFRWWREQSDGAVEEDRHPSSALGGFVKGYIGPLVVYGAGALLVMLASKGAPLTWLIWIIGGGGCLTIIRFGRKRGWY